MVYILIAVPVVILLYVFTTYNSFVTIKARIRASIQEIGNQLKRQANLIPNLESAVKGYYKFEKSIFKELTEARKIVLKAIESGETQQMVDASRKLSKAIAPIRVVFESNPQMQASANVANLMNNIVDTSDKVMYARRTLIDLSADYNIKLATIPSGWVGKLFGFTPEKGLKTPEEGPHLEVSASELETPKIEA